MEHDERVEALKDVTQSASVARRVAMQTEAMGDDTFREFVAFKTIEMWEVAVDQAVVYALIKREKAAKFHDMVIPREGRTVQEWTKAVFEALIERGVISVTIEELESFYQRRAEAQEMAPKGKAVRYPRGGWHRQGTQGTEGGAR